MSKGLYINGVWKNGQGLKFQSSNPATGEVIWEAASATASDVADAVSAARAAFPAWSQLSVDERMAYVLKFKTLLAAELEAITELVCKEAGKVRWDARTEVQAAVGKAEISLTAYNTRTGVSASENNGIRAVLRHRPHGVMAVFGPYNFPVHLPNGHIIPALIAGNTVVYKPSEQTPLVAEAYIALWEKAGLPKGVINLVQGARETGMALANPEQIDGLLFTGSVEVGAILHKQFAGHPGKMLALELGGNNPLIMWDVANTEAAASIAVQSGYLTTGQRCTCARRLIVPQGNAGDAIIEATMALANRLIIGAYTDTPEPFMGPLISNREADRLLDAQKNLVAGGAKPLLEMKRLREGLPFVSPALLDVTGATREDREYFGPLLQVVRVPDFESAVREANATQYGLSASIVTDSTELHEQYYRCAHAGIVNWNRPTNGAAGGLPFGGLGVSGNHRPSAFYAADYCAYPVASQELDLAAVIPMQGIR